MVSHVVIVHISALSSAYAPSLVPPELLRLSHKVFGEDEAKMRDRRGASALCGTSSTKEFFNRLRLLGAIPCQSTTKTLH